MDESSLCSQYEIKPRYSPTWFSNKFIFTSLETNVYTWFIRDKCLYLVRWAWSSWVSSHHKKVAPSFLFALQFQTPWRVPSIDSATWPYHHVLIKCYQSNKCILYIHFSRGVIRSAASSCAAMHMVAGSRPVFVIAWEWHIGLALLCGCSGALEYPTTNSYRPINKSLSLSLNVNLYSTTS